VIQYNKRDMDNIVPVEKMREEINFYNVPDFEASALKGDGVMNTLKAVVKLVVAQAKKDLSR
jgi:signal recognition particle receptor subunit beta